MLSMSGPSKQRKVDELLEKVRESLARGMWFEAERLAEKALASARQEEDFQSMARAIDPLQEARAMRLRLALEAAVLRIHDVPGSENMKIESGCYLVQPPLVGSEARRLRLAGLINDIPIAVLCREPLTRSGEVPVVAISPGSTIRTKVPPPENAKKPDLVWFAAAMAELGDGAIESIDSSMPVIRRIDALLDALDALPEHENLHRALKGACEEAHELQGIERAAAAAKSAAKAKVKSEAH
jgi:hypothetical protein